MAKKRKVKKLKPETTKVKYLVITAEHSFRIDDKYLADDVTSLLTNAGSMKVLKNEVMEEEHTSYSWDYIDEREKS